MRIALIAPPYPLEEAPSPPLGICYIAAVCEKAGHQVELFDFIVSRYSPGKLERRLTRFAPHVVGINAVTMNVKGALAIIDTVKKIDPAIITMMGGPHVSFDYRQVLSCHPALDIVVVGEGEATLAELLPVVQQPSQWSAVRGLAIRDADGTPVATPPRPAITDLDRLPLPARHLLPISRYLALGFPVSITTTRGCPNHCIFCLGRRMVGYQVRKRSISAVMDEIESILAWGFAFINIADDTFTTDRDRALEFCAAIRRRRLTFTWSAFARVNTVDTALLKAMKEAGCHAVSFGIESGNPAMLKRIRKGITVKQVKKAAACCREAGIRAHASFLVGLPGESEQTLRDATALIESIGIEYGYHVLAPFPGTTVRERLADYDLEILSSDWDHYNARKAIVQTSCIGPEELERFVREQYRPITERWQAALDRYHDGTANPQERADAENHYRLMLVYDLLSGDRIEKTPLLPADLEDPLVHLVDHISKVNGREKKLVRRVLGDLAAKGYLDCRTAKKGRRWEWCPNRTAAVSHAS